MSDRNVLAFPTTIYNHGDGMYASEGMTLRDYFASKVDVSIYTPLEILATKLGRDPTVTEMAEYIAIIRFIESKAMLKAREQ